MAESKRRHSWEFKAQVALAALRGDRTMSDLCNEFKVHPTVISRWKKQVLDFLPVIFSGKPGVKPRAAAADRDRQSLLSLQKELGRLRHELAEIKENESSPDMD